MIKQFPENPQERCHYSLACEDPNNTTGQGLRDTNKKCARCPGKREDAVRNKCYSEYNGVVSGKIQVLRRREGFIEGGEGFILSRDYNIFRKEALKIEEKQQRIQALERELLDLESLPKGCIGTGAVMRITELKQILGKD